jgi:uncharacterized protein
MLELRPNCECCNKDLPPESTEAVICTFECTFCMSCAQEKLGGICPNCGGDFAARPHRPFEKLSKYPASTKRVYMPDGCNELNSEDIGSQLQQKSLLLKGRFDVDEEN